VLSAFVAELSRSHRHRAKREHGLPSVSLLHTGSVTFVQRADSAPRLNVHAHTLSLDGVYVRAESGQLQFLRALLLRHVFAADVSLCVHCKGRMRLHELCTTPDAIARAMAQAGLGPRPPPTAQPTLRAYPAQGLLPFG
jgi:hypothetical protein